MCGRGHDGAIVQPPFVFHESLPAGGEFGESTPVVAIAGWLGCNDKHLLKYAEAFNSLGAAVVRGTMPGGYVFSPFDAGRKRYAAAALEAVEAVRTRGGVNRNVYWIFFSNGGAWVWVAMQNMLADGGAFFAHGRALRGVAFDSSPAYMHLFTGAAALTETMRQPLKAIVYSLFVIVAGAWDVVAKLTFTASWLPSKRFWPLLTNARTPPKELYLYSEDDHLCDAAKLRELMLVRQSRPGSKVSAVHWKSSRHVGHLLMHRDEYLEALVDFLS